MTLQPEPFRDFNRMLVLSVFFHCLLMTVALYLPKLKSEQKIIKPAFMVQLLESPTAPSAPKPSPEANKTAAEKAVSPPVKNMAPTPAAKPKPKPRPAPVKREVAKKPLPRVQPAPPPLVVKPAEIKKREPSKVLKELDQVASLTSQKKVLQPAPSKPLLEETVRELEALKEEKVTLPIPVKPRQPYSAPPATPKSESLKKEDREFQSLLETKPQIAAVTQPKTKSKLLQELENLKELEEKLPSTVTATRSTSRAPAPSKTVSSKVSKTLDDLNALRPGQNNVSISSKAEVEAKSYQSQLRNVQSPEIRNTVIPATDENPLKAEVTTSAGGSEDAGMLSRYVAMVRQKVYSNWKNPMGAEKSRVKLAFYIFPGGNIEKPMVLQSSGSDQLDTLALRAVRDSEPFPPFPKDLKEPNLHITIHFNYVLTNP